MANASYFAANKIQDYILGSVAFTVPSTWYLAISTTAPQADGTGVTEPTDPAYARLAIPNNKVSFGSSSNGTVVTIDDFQFPESTQNQGVIAYWALYDSLTGGDYWEYGTLTNSRTVEIATTLLLPAGQFSSTVE